MSTTKRASAAGGAKREDVKPDIKKPLNEGYMKIPPSITDQFGEQFARELYDEKKINLPANTIDVRFESNSVPLCGPVFCSQKNLEHGDPSFSDSKGLFKLCYMGEKRLLASLEPRRCPFHKHPTFSQCSDLLFAPLPWLACPTSRKNGNCCQRSCVREVW